MEERADIGTLRSSYCKFEVNPSSSLGGDVKYFDRQDRWTNYQIVSTKLKL